MNADQGNLTASDTQPMLLCAASASKLVGVSTRHWLRLCDRGAAPAGLHLGRRRLWRRDELVEWVKNGCPKVRRCV